MSSEDVESNGDIAPLPEGPTQRKGGNVLQQQQRLSKVSQMYDVDGDGKLDEVEKAMRDMDSREMGHLSNEKVYKILQEQMKAQKDLLSMKRFVIALAMFTFILALSNLGTAFAAARLAKDTQLTAEGVMVAKQKDNVGGDQQQPVAVRVEAKTYELIPIEGGRRRRRMALEGCTHEDGTSGQCATVDVASGTIYYWDAEALYTRCLSNQLTFIKQFCPDTNEYVVRGDICHNYAEPQTNRQGQGTTWKYLNQKIRIGWCNPGEQCEVSFNNGEFPCPAVAVNQEAPACSETNPQAISINYCTHDDGRCEDSAVCSDYDGKCFQDSDCDQAAGFYCGNCIS